MNLKQKETNNELISMKFILKNFNNLILYYKGQKFVVGAFKRIKKAITSERVERVELLGECQTRVKIRFIMLADLLLSIK